MKVLECYRALALQTSCFAVNKLSSDDAKRQMDINLKRIEEQIMASKSFIGNDLKLVVLPEYFLTGFPMGETIEAWQQKACIKISDSFFNKIKQVAKRANVYLSGNYYEIDKNFEYLYFQSSFIINPSGKLLLNYRRLNSMYAPTPHDVLDKYLKLYGKKSLFPVVKTELGNLACVASEEILYPEIARSLALNGAEVLLHSSSEVASPMPTQKNIAKIARAFENMSYVISANSAGILNIDIPAQSTDAHSQIVQYDGLKLCEAGYGESMVANAAINISALRQFRQRPGMANLLARQRNELFIDTYNKKIYPANSINTKRIERSHFAETQKKVIEILTRKN